MRKTPNIEHAQSSDGYDVRRPEEVMGPGDRHQRRRDDVRDDARDDDHPFGFLTNFNPMSSFRRMFDHMNDFFSDTGSLFGNMDRAFEDARRSPEGTHYVSSTSMCMLPGGVKEVKQRVVANGKDVETHTRAIGDRYISNRREQDIRTGREDVSRNLYDVQEHEVDSFTRDFDQRMSQMPMRELFDRGNPHALLGNRDRYDRYDGHRALRDRSGDDYGRGRYYDRDERSRDRDHHSRGYSGDNDADRMRLSGSRRY